MLATRDFYKIENENLLVAPDGTVKGPWEATGSGRRSNMFGYQTAKAVAQDAYGAALADLLSELNVVSQILARWTLAAGAEPTA